MPAADLVRPGAHVSTSGLAGSSGAPIAAARQPALEAAISRGWLVLHESGTYVKFTPAGAELFA
jgi:hypothetical protein